MAPTQRKYMPHTHIHSTPSNNPHRLPIPAKIRHQNPSPHKDSPRRRPPTTRARTNGPAAAPLVQGCAGGEELGGVGGDGGREAGGAGWVEGGEGEAPGDWEWGARV